MDVSIQNYHAIETRRPKVIIIDKTKNECKVIDLACTFDRRIEEREKD